jgi:hypothetical protein
MAKQLINYVPVFTPGASGAGTLDFSTYAGVFDANKLYAVINVTQNTPIYVAGAPGLGFTAIAGPVVTLGFNTSTYNTNDLLNIYYDVAPGYESNTPAEFGGFNQEQSETLNQILVELKAMNLILAQGLNINKDDVDALRSDFNDTTNIII